MTRQSKAMNDSEDVPIDIMEVIHTKANPYPRHHHLQKEMLFIIDGEGKLELKGKTYSIRKGDLILLDVEESHQITDSRNALLSLFRIGYWDRIWNEVDDGDRLAAVFSSIPLDKRVLSTFDSPRLSAIPHLLREMLREKEGGYPLGFTLVKAKLMEILVRIERHFRREDATYDEVASESERHVARVIHYVHRTYSDNWRLQSAAEMAALSARQFATLFKKQTGTTFHEYLTTYRVEKAKAMLVDTEENERKNIAHICFSIGFNEVSTFYRAFKKHTGMTPKQFLAGHI